jgi:endo-1,4-beta-xylanase
LITDEFTVPITDSTLARGPVHFNFGANVGKTIYLDSLRITQITGLPEDSSGYPVIVEAESGELGSDFNIIESYISISTNFINASYPGENRKASYQVTFPDTGSYDLFARVNVGPNGFDDDSFFFGNGFGVKNDTAAADWLIVNGLATSGFSTPSSVVRDAGSLGSDEWKWVNLSRNGYQTAPIPITIDTPEDLIRTFEIGAREDGLGIDKFAFGKSYLYFTVENLDSVQAGSETDPTEPVEPPDEVLPIARNKTKFLGNIYSTSQLPRFTEFWNQVTPENAGKWGSVEGTRDNMNWGALDNAYALAKDNDFPFRFHVLVWGNQQPNWITNLPAEEQLEEIEEWFAAVAARYPDIDYLEVVNEPLHDPPNNDDNGGGNYFNALGGNNDLYGTGWDWVIKAFELARQYFPDSTKLIINDYSITNNTGATTTYLTIINLLKDRELIDGIAVQAHAFSTTGAMSTHTNNLNRLAATELPIQVTEMDIDGPSDEVQLASYQRIFPTFWEHPGVIGITFWGWRPGMWRTDQMAYLIDNDGNERPALGWLREYVENYEPTAIEETVKEVLGEFRVHNNYPNPFNPSTQITYDVPTAAHVSIDVFDITGRLVEKLVNNRKSPGSYTVTFNAANLSSGIYIYRFKAGSYTEFKRMVMIK